MNNTFALLLYVKKKKMKSDGTVPIYLRVTVERVRFEIATKQYVIPSQWNPAGQRLKGNTDSARSLNSYLTDFQNEIYEISKNVCDSGLPLTADTLKNFILKKERQTGSRMLIPIFQQHNARIKALVGKEFAERTYVRYQTSLQHTISFLKWKYQVSDYNINNINHEFITSYDFYLRSERNCGNNSTVKYLKNFKKIIRICTANGWLDKDPFVNYKAKVKEVVRDFLTTEELSIMTAKVFASERLTQVRDIFLFSCYTGLAYADVQKLKSSEVAKGEDGQQWIFTSRQKTETSSRIPILPIAELILKKYEDYPECVHKGKVLPVMSNQKMNSYLKEIADFCGINKLLTFHIARHTFATTVTLSNGVPIESVSKMLGHKNLRTTQHYAKILDKKVGDDMMTLRRKLALSSNII